MKSILLTILSLFILSACSEEKAPLNPPLSAETIPGQIEQIIAEQLGRKAGSFSLDDPLADKLGADELDVVELVLAIEEEFDVSIPDERLFEPAETEEELGAPRKLTGNDFVRIVEELQAAK